MLFALLPILTGCSDAPRAADRLSAVTSRQELRVCSTGDYRPFTFRDTAGKWSGIDIDMARDLARSLGVRVSFVPTSWRNLLTDFRAHCDIAVGGVSATVDRARQAAFSISYLSDGKTPITRCEHTKQFGTLAQIDRPEVRVVVNPGGTNEQFAKTSLARATLIEWPDNNTIFDRITAGAADLMVTDAVEARWQAGRHPGLCAVHPDQPFTHSTKVYLLPPDEPAFRERIDSWLGAMLRDGGFTRISDPWLSGGGR